MRAVSVPEFGSADVLRTTVLPVPEPGAGELTIDVDHAGVGFVDTLFRRGDFPVRTPFVPGIEVSGTVRTVGAGVDTFTPGQPVSALLNDFGRGERAGGYAEVAVAHASMTVPLTADADPAAAAGALVNGVTGWLALHDLARLGVGEDVLVLGASGGLGGIAVRLAALRPARRVIGVVGDPARAAQLPAECTDVVPADRLTEAVLELTGGRGVDVVIDPVGGPARSAAFGLLSPFGRHVVLGNASGDDPALSGDAAWHGTRQLIGLSLGATAHLIPERIAAAGSAVTGLLARGVLREPAPAVRPLADAAAVHRALEARTAPPKTVLALR